MSNITGFDKAQREYENKLPPEPDRMRVCSKCDCEYNFEDANNTDAEYICDRCFNELFNE